MDPLSAIEVTPIHPLDAPSTLVLVNAPRPL